MTTLFQSLSDHLLTQCPQVAVVDLDKGQLSFSGGEGSMPIATPAVLLGFWASGVEEIDASQDMVTMQISVRVAIDHSVSETSSATPAQWREKSLAPLELIKDITTALRGYTNEEITPLTRTSISKPETRSDSLFVQTITFTGYYTENF